MSGAEKALEQAIDGVETPKLTNLHLRMVTALSQAARDRKALNATSRRLKKTVGAKS